MTRKQYLESFVLFLWQVLLVDQIEETILRILCSILVVDVVSRLDRGNNTQNSLFYTCGRCCQQTRQRKQYLEFVVLYLWQVLSVDQIEETILRIRCSILVVGVVSRLDRGNNTQNSLFYTCGRCCQQTRQRKQYLESFVLFLWQMLLVDQIEETILRILCSILVVDVVSRLDRGNNSQNTLFYTCGRCCQQTRQRKQYLESFVLYLWQMLSVDQIEETILRILCSILVVGAVSRLDRGNNTQNPLFYTCGRCCQQTIQRKQFLESFVLYLWQMLSVDQIEETMLRILCSILVVDVVSRLDRGNNAQNSLFYTCGRCCQQTRQRKQYLEFVVLCLWQVLSVDQIEETMLRIRCSILVVDVVSRLDRGNNTQNSLFYTCGRCCQQTRQRKQYLESFVLYLWQMLSVDQIEETMLRILCSILVVGVVSRLDRGNNAQNSLFYTCGRCCQQTRQRKQYLESFVLYLWQMLSVDQIEETMLRIRCSIHVVGVVSRLDRGNNTQNPLFYTCDRCCQQTRQRKQYLEFVVLFLWQVLSVDQIEETMLRILCSMLVVDVVSRLDRGNNTQNPLFYACGRCCQQTRQRKQCLEFVVLYLWQVLSVDQIEETVLRILCSMLVVDVVSRLDRGNNTQNPLFYTCGRCCQQTRQRKQYLESFVLFLWQVLSVDQIEETMLRIRCSILVVGVVSRLDRGNNTQNPLFYSCDRCCQQTRQRKQYLESFVLYL